MKESILKRYPELKDEDVFLRDDGEGVYIEKWNSDKPQPTMSQVNVWVEQDANIPKPLSTEERLSEAEQMINLLLLGGF